MITIEQLTVSYDRKNTVIENLDLTLESNCIHGIVGLNGSGKTTLLNAIYGIKKLDSGSIFIDGIKSNMKQYSYLESENFFYSNITGAEYLGIFKNKEFELDKWNEFFKLPLFDIIDTYSTGMKKKLALLAVLKQDKQIMILDEPFNGLDIESARILRSILLNIRDRKTIIITSHIIETLTNLCDKICYLESGKIKYISQKEHFDTFEKELFDSIESKNQEAIKNLTSEK